MKKIKKYDVLKSKDNGKLSGGFAGLTNKQMNRITAGLSSNTEGCHKGCTNTGDCSEGTNYGEACTNHSVCSPTQI